MRPSSRLDLLLVPCDPLAPVAEGLVEGWLADGVLGAAGAPGPRATALAQFHTWRLDQPGQLTLWANRQGGFSVSCPTCGANLVSSFVPAWEAGRRVGVLPRLPCPACGQERRLDALSFRPAAAFATWAVELADVAGPDLAPGARARWPELAAMVVVLRRG